MLGLQALEDGLLHLREELLALMGILDGCEEFAMEIHHGVHQGYLGFLPISATCGDGSKSDGHMSPSAATQTEHRALSLELDSQARFTPGLWGRANGSLTAPSTS